MKKIAYSVIAVHCIFFLWMAIWSPVKQVEKKPLKVRTIVKAPPPPPPAPAPAPPVTQVVKAPAVQKKSPPKKTVPKKPTPKKPTPKKTAPQKAAPQKPVIPQKLVNELRASLAKIDEKPQKVLTSKALKTPKSIATLKVDQSDEEVEDGYVASLVECLQSTLNLPETGEVKLALTLTSDGRFTKLQVLKSGSSRNRVFLENELKALRFPSFTGQLKQDKEHTFVLSFYSS